MSDYHISSDRRELDMDAMIRLIHLTRWAAHRPEDIIRKSIENSLTFGVLGPSGQVGMARIVTDYATFAYLCDVVIDPDFRGLGLSKLLMRAILDHPDLKTVRRWALLTLDAHGLYRQFGFENHPDNKRYLQIFDGRDQQHSAQTSNP